MSSWVAMRIFQSGKSRRISHGADPRRRRCPGGTRSPVGSQIRPAANTAKEHRPRLGHFSSTALKTPSRCSTANTIRMKRRGRRARQLRGPANRRRDDLRAGPRWGGFVASDRTCDRCSRRLSLRSCSARAWRGIPRSCSAHYETTEPRLHFAGLAPASLPYRVQGATPTRPAPRRRGLSLGRGAVPSCVRMNVKSRGVLHGIVQQFVLGVGDDELKRRRLGFCLPRCLPL